MKYLVLFLMSMFHFLSISSSKSLKKNGWQFREINYPYRFKVLKSQNNIDLV